MSRSSLLTSWKYILVATIAVAITYNFIPPKIEYKEKLVTKVKERVRTHTVIKESPNGAKETIITQVVDKDTSSTYSKSQTVKSKDTTIVATMTVDRFSMPTPTYGIGFTKSLILGLSGGLYITNNKDFGLILSYSF